MESSSQSDTRLLNLCMVSKTRDNFQWSILGKEKCFVLIAASNVLKMNLP